ncbi:hypothetical protein COY28_03505 [Candidatus Woesearchaeota archaeon CG_4_10_14_0_2_um_filter_57_5]|nr:MAG: hypothetical protein COY28_03505 [Candidatus Woesearchaeota archaeon CG_4_10_14_0_2_um_filter_57_5]
MALVLGPVLLVVAIVACGGVYWKTKSWAKTGHTLQVLLALLALVYALQYVAVGEIRTVLLLLSVGLLLDGVIDVAD